MRHLSATIVSAALIGAAALTAPDVASAAPSTPEPTYVAPSSRSITLNRHGVVTDSTLRHCRQEDGSGQRGACSWNVGTTVDGNGIGLAFYLPRTEQGEHPAARRARYVWDASPVIGHPRRTWVTRAQADALQAEQRRAWQRCYVHTGPTSTVVCADGTRVRS